ncbi:MAG: EFR1 family ferrodoxin [Vallitaleaceae bacterium]|nr:EFR1 family ferrodoxin [Vallitaleaceae bacterium]
MSTEIYYFSGTGNSLFVARELQKKIPDSVIIPIVSLLHEDVIKTNGKTIGIVFPCHALTIPLAVKQFVKKIDLQSAEYFFAIATRYGTVFKGFSMISRLLKRRNKRLDSQFILNMCHNEAPRSDKNYVVPSKSDILKIEVSILHKIDEISNIIKNKSPFIEKDNNAIIKSSSNPIIGFLIEQLVVFLMNISEYMGGVNYFYHDSQCTGCGICEKVCLSKKIKIIDKKPVWQKSVLCYMCYACVNYCPMHSVQVKDIPSVKSYTAKNGRYPHPYATANDISAQKEYFRVQL